MQPSPFCRLDDSSAPTNMLPSTPTWMLPKVTILSGEGKTEWLAEGGELKPHLRWSRKAEEDAEELSEMKKRETGVEEDPKQKHIVHSAVCTAIVITISIWSLLAQEVTPRTRREW
ncbi:solute carrier family 5 [Echinococcus multilocularis]|uniref:Solute carrier family 5 n=1 Tax=Echinococcus multilocularis TaxID=6211 RepID=A0A0S4MKM8_ECHMU|nr:solute carrier family 5 [Echinococcus multilocularis]